VKTGLTSDLAPQTANLDSGKPIDDVTMLTAVVQRESDTDSAGTKLQPDVGLRAFATASRTGEGVILTSPVGNNQIEMTVYVVLRSRGTGIKAPSRRQGR
jgi:hypothetical protein